MTLCVASHWLLDLVTHRPDLLLVPWGERFYGLGLWNSRAGTLVVELAMFGVAVVLYARATQARDRPGRIGLWALVGFLGLVYWVTSSAPRRRVNARSRSRPSPCGFSCLGPPGWTGTEQSGPPGRRSRVHRPDTVTDGHDTGYTAC